MINRRKFDGILPFKPLFTSWKRKLVSTFNHRSALLNWEQMATARIEHTHFIRADLDSPDAWTLHAIDHGPQFRNHLAAIIDKVEAGCFPAEQAGHYDLHLGRWTEAHSDHLPESQIWA
jgi:hypothetical protein